MVHRIKERATGSRTGLGTSGTGTSKLAPLGYAVSIRMTAILSGYYYWDTGRRLDVTCLQLNGYKGKLSLASGFNSAVLREAFWLVQLGLCSYSLDRSLWLVGCYTMFGIGSCVSLHPLRSRCQNKIKCIKVLFREMPV